MPLEVYYMFLTNCAHSIFLILPSQLSQFKGKYSSFRLHLLKKMVFSTILDDLKGSLQPLL